MQDSKCEADSASWGLHKATKFRKIDQPQHLGDELWSWLRVNNLDEPAEEPAAETGEPLRMRKGWKEVTSEDGKVYYVNMKTKQTSWKMPHEKKKKEKKEKNGWREVATKDGQVYYYNKKTKETSWDLPA